MAKTNPATSVEDLRKAIQSLSDADRTTLLESFCADVRQDQKVLIHDRENDDIGSPRAKVIFPKRPGQKENERQMIDIVATVRANAASIGHPAILCAIKRWETLVIYQGVGR